MTAPIYYTGPPHLVDSAPAPDVTAGTVPALDWRDGSHSARGGSHQPCRYCRYPTWLIDDEHRPAHKTCAEAAAITEGDE